jgi:DNA polymerase-3 subunit delta'
MRPNSTAMPFRDVAGHRHLLDLVRSAAVRSSLPPSLIFAGPEGVGKRTAAVALAQLVNCARPVAAGDDRAGMDACGVCAACTRIARGVHSDVLTIEPGETGTIKVDQVREAIDRAGYRPFEGRRRVVIIDDADAMMSEAQNALLKTLEEPPAASTFVLIASRPDVLLPTVRSRCQRLRFGRLAASEIAAVLMQAHGYRATHAHAAASAADGSVGRALEGGSEEFVEARDAASDLLRVVAASNDPRRRLDAAKALIGVSGRGRSDREELARRLRALASMIRDLGLLASQATTAFLANIDLAPMLSRLTGAFDRERAVRAFEAVDRALAALDRNASPKIVADWLAVQL